MADPPPSMGPHQLYAYEPPISLWELIKSYVPEHELQEIKNILGESLVEQSIELHQEVCIGLVAGQHTSSHNGCKFHFQYKLECIIMH